jgi:hypothetical protein
MDAFYELFLWVGAVLAKINTGFPLAAICEKCKLYISEM